MYMALMKDEQEAQDCISNYDMGLQILTHCYDETIDRRTGVVTPGNYVEIEGVVDSNQSCSEDKEKSLTGGKKEKKPNNNTQSFADRIFSEQFKKSLGRVIKGSVRTSTGSVAVLLSVGAGGDVLVNSAFAVASSNSFIKNIYSLVNDMRGAKELFSSLISIDFRNKVPISSKITLDYGFDVFEKNFEAIFSSYIKKYGTRLLSRVYESIQKVLDKVTTTVADWVACLFPDTAGLAGELAKNILDTIVNKGYTLVYNLVSLIPDNLQRMLTNYYSLIDYIKYAVLSLRQILLNLTPEQISEIIKSIGEAAGKFTDSSFNKGAINFGASVASGVAAAGTKLYSMSSAIGSHFSILPKPEEMIVSVIDKYIIPNIVPGCRLFYQIFPLFLQFTLFIEKYDTIVGKHIVPQSIPRNPITGGEDSSITTQITDRVEVKQRNDGSDGVDNENDGVDNEDDGVDNEDDGVGDLNADENDDDWSSPGQ
jgi:hypothetical protein